MKKRHILAALILCAVLTLTFALSSCLKKKTTPVEYIADAITATLEAKTDSAFLSVLESAEKKGSVALVYRNTDDLAAFGIPIDNFSITGYMGEKYSAGMLNMTVGGKTVDFRLWSANDKLAVSSSLAGSAVYGVDFTNAKEKYLQSVFADPESEYSLTELFGEEGNYFDTVKSTSEIGKKLIEIFEKYEEHIIVLLNDHAHTSLDSEEGGKVVSLELNNESFKKIIKALYDKAKEDSELRAALSDLAEMYAGMPDITDDEDLIWIPEKEYSIEYDSNKIMEEYDNFFASEDQLERFFEKLDEITFSFKLVIHTDKKDLIKRAELSCGTASADGSDEAIWIFSADLSDENKSVFTVKQTGEDAAPVLSSGITLIYEITENTDKEFRSNFSVKTGGMTLDILDVEYDKASGEYKLSSAVATTLAVMSGSVSSAGEVSVSGIFKADKSSVVVTVTSLQAGAMKAASDITLTILAKDAVPDYPANVIDIFALDEKTIDQLITKIEAGIGEFELEDIFE